jgi:hypothetical protein
MSAVLAACFVLCAVSCLLFLRVAYFKKNFPFIVCNLHKMYLMIPTIL